MEEGFSVRADFAKSKSNLPRAKRRRDTDGKRSRNRGRTLGGQKFAKGEKVDDGLKAGTEKLKGLS